MAKELDQEPAVDAGRFAEIDDELETLRCVAQRTGRTAQVAALAA